MQDREFTLAKSLLTALAGRSRSSTAAETCSKDKALSSTTATTAAQSAHLNRRHRFDDKSGPPPPRGSLTSDKLTYLDWRLKRINNVRRKSEGTSQCWIDGRDTIGRTSFDFQRPTCVTEGQEECIAPAPAPATAIAYQVPMPPSITAAMYAEEKAVGLKALTFAYANDSIIASMPHLAKRDSSSGSELSGSSDQHASHAPVVLDASDEEVGTFYFIKPRRSLFLRASSRISKKRSVRTSTLVHQPGNVANKAADNNSAPRNNRSFSRFWNR